MPKNTHDLNAMFSISHEPSAHLMLTNALYLLQAGSIDAREAAAVFRRASEVVYREDTRQAAQLH